MNKVTTGSFITFEGGEGAGKSTQIKRLAARLEALSIPVTLTREPGGSPGAEEIRTLLVTGEGDRWSGLSESLLHFAARADHLERLIKPARLRGDWVLCDRFADSTLAYQGGGHGLNGAAIQTLYDLVVGEQGPELTLILDLPVEAGLARAASRGEGEDRYEKMGLAFHERLRAAFLEIACQNPQRCVVIDATFDIDTVEDTIWTAVSKRFSLSS